MKKISKLAAFAVACSLALTAVGCNTNAAESPASVLGNASISDFKANVAEGVIVVSWTKPDGLANGVSLYRYDDKTGSRRIAADVTNPSSGVVDGTTFYDFDIEDGVTYTYILINKGLYTDANLETWLSTPVTTVTDGATGITIVSKTDKDTTALEGRESIIAKVSAKANVPYKLSAPTESDLYIYFEKDYTGMYALDFSPKGSGVPFYDYTCELWDKVTGTPIDFDWKPGDDTPQFPFVMKIIKSASGFYVHESDPFVKEFDFTSSFITRFTVTLDPTSKEDTIIATWPKQNVASEANYKVYIKDSTKPYQNWTPVDTSALTTDPTDPTDENCYLEIECAKEKTAKRIDVLVIAETAEGKAYDTRYVTVSALEFARITMDAVEIDGEVVFQFNAPANVPATDIKVLRSEKGNKAGTWIDVTESVTITSQAQMYGEGDIAYQVVDKNIANRKNYTYKVVAGKTYDTTSAVPIDGNVVGRITASYDAADKTVEIKWTATREGGEFVVYRAEQIEGSSEYGLYAPVTVTTKVEKTLAGKELEYTAVDATVAPYKTYKYYVAASDDNNIAATVRALSPATVTTTRFVEASNLRVSSIEAAIDPDDPTKKKVTNVVLTFEGDSKAADKYEVFYTTFDNKDNESEKKSVATTTDNTDDYEATVKATDLGIDSNNEFKLTKVRFYVYSYKNGKDVNIQTKDYSGLPTSYKTLTSVTATSTEAGKVLLTVTGHNLKGNVVKFYAQNGVDAKIALTSVTLAEMKVGDTVVTDTYEATVTSLTKGVKYLISATLAEEETADFTEVHIIANEGASDPTVTVQE